MIANKINGGEPIARLYPGDVSTLAVAKLTEVVGRAVAYPTDTQGVVMLVSIGIAIYVLVVAPGLPRQLALLVAIGGSLNLLYFITHNAYNPYYLMPASMLSAWSLFFGAYFRDRSGVGPVPLVLLSQKDAFCELGIIDRFGRFVFRHEELRWIIQYLLTVHRDLKPMSRDL